MCVAPGVNPGNKEITQPLLPLSFKRGARGEFFSDNPEQIRG